MALIRSKNHLLVIKLLLHVTCLTPAVWMFWLGATDMLGADPVKALIHFYGIGSIHCLFATLAVSPAIRWTKTPALLQVRRMLGLYAAFYASMHIICFVVFEWQLQWLEIGKEIIKRPYITVGMVTWVLLAILSFTSFKRAQRALGKRWGQVHALVYPLLVLALVHFYWSQKSPLNEAILYGMLGVSLLAWRQNKLFIWFEFFRSSKHTKTMHR
ncbi:sulfite oxidase heme-binding subunit YedZ [Echinimonas agarilytica]|uniref:Protein-methionine-sulfoxide reductase heme-binding subunit MsrQ n=1 Tax=Echinimonas agarilytica TaxID=1215918 RepID=A0AA41W923_9GAMM|nr:protein-methionine-sulfoxide reductase heme-binding subunit MsrQ [Echinimonas agarilytica]MCM2681315.1 sulfoxide reductase heme-binding subunit YedZ [Echinimonas agarilytica]